LNALEKVNSNTPLIKWYVLTLNTTKRKLKMSKFATIVVLALLLSFGLIYASRPNVGLNSVASIDEVRFSLNFSSF
jgi:hypothetical protein